MCDESVICRRNGCFEKATKNIELIELYGYTVPVCSKHASETNAMSKNILGEIDELRRQLSNREYWLERYAEQTEIKNKQISDRGEKINELKKELENLKIEDARLVRCNNDAYNSIKERDEKIKELQKIIDNGVSHNSLCNRIPTIQIPRHNVIELYRSENKDLKEQIKNKDSEIAYLKGVNMGKQIRIDDLQKSCVPPDMSGVACVSKFFPYIAYLTGYCNNTVEINLKNIYEGTLAFKSGVIDDFEKGCFWILDYMTKDGPMDIATLKQVIFDCPDKAMYAYKFLRDQLLKLRNGDE